MRRNAIIILISEMAMFISIIALACSVIGQSNTIKKYEAILDTSCKRSLNVAGCKSGVEMLKKMSTEDIEKWGY